MLSHQLTKKNNQWHCSLCDCLWKGKPRMACPGVPIVRKTKRELEFLQERTFADCSVLLENSAYFIRRNLRPLDRVACVKRGKDYIYLYNPDGETEKIDPDLPPVLPVESCDDLGKKRTDTHCLKSKTGLRKLNLSNEGVDPIAVYYRYGDFCPLYNPLDCGIRIANFPKNTLNYWEYKELLRKKKFLNNKARARLNLKPKEEATAFAAYWENSDWNLLYEPEQCEIADLSLPSTVFSNSYFKSDLISSLDLSSLNLKPRENQKAIACYLDYGNNWILLWDIKQCELIDPELPQIVTKIPQGWYEAKDLVRFNRIPSNPVGAIYDYPNFVLLYKPKECKIKDPNLPPLYEYKNIPENLFKRKDLTPPNRRNLKLKKTALPKGTTWDYLKEDFAYLYDLADCEIDDPNLPPIIKHDVDCDRDYEFNWEYIPVGNALKSEIGLKRLNLKPEKAQPVAVCWDYPRFKPLYNPLDCQIAIADLPPIISWDSWRNGDLWTLEKLEDFNLQPRKNQTAIAVCWHEDREDWNYLFDIKQCEQIYKGKPPVYIKQPSWLYKERELKRLNLRRGIKTKPVALLTKYCGDSYLYDPAECDLINPSLPPCYDKKNIPGNLKSEWAWQQSEPLFKLKENAIAQGCFLKGSKIIYLYDRSQLELHAEDIKISKTKLQQNYKFNQDWLKRLGEPDEISDFEINNIPVVAHLYWRSRVEDFLAENAEEYLEFLSRKRKPPKVFQALDSATNLREEIQERLQDINSRKDQQKLCLTCGYGAAIPKGFLCTIFPFGVEEIPCHEWRAKK